MDSRCFIGKDTLLCFLINSEMLIQVSEYYFVVELNLGSEVVLILEHDSP